MIKIPNFMLLLALIVLIILSIFLRYYWSIDWKDIVMADAVIIGPIFAIIITRSLDEERFSKERKLAIFRALVKDRSNPLSYDFVSSLNSIQIEFADNKNVIETWKALSESRNTPAPTREDSEGWARKGAEWNSKTNNLLWEIAKVLNIKINPFDIQASYFPAAWGNEQQTNTELKSGLLNLLKKKGSISVKLDNSGSPTLKMAENDGTREADCAKDC